MMTSKLFLSVWIVSGLMIAASMWDGNTVAMTLGAAVIGGGLFGAVVNFLWRKIEKRW